MLRFAGFELDQRRSELRGPDGVPIRLRPKAFDLLWLLASNPRRLVGKHALMEAVWPGLHVSEDSLFQCVRDLRNALGDDKRQLIRAVPGRGYLLEAEVSGPEIPALPVPAESSAAAGSAPDARPADNHAAKGFGRRTAMLAMVGLGLSALAAASTRLPRLGGSARPSIAILPIATTADARMAADVTRDLTDGLVKIETIRVGLPTGDGAPATDLVVGGELEMAGGRWTLRARLTEPATGAVRWSGSVAIDQAGLERELQRTRLAAGLGHALAQRLNVLINAGERSADGLPAGSTRAAIEQATASINQTTPERFQAAQTMLERALADDAGNVDLQVALAAFQLRGVQMAWFPVAERAAVQERVGAIVERALRAQPDYIPVLDMQCRYLSTTNRFVESLVACGKSLAHDPWNGSALYLIGLAQIFLGRFEEALATFERADRFDTPQVARWTWAIGAGWVHMLMERPAEALPWLQRSIAITPASGRTHMLLAAAYHQLGRDDEARAAMATALTLRPGSTARNTPPPSENTSPVYLAANERLLRRMIAAGLPEDGPG